MENFVLNGNGQIDINRKGMDSGYKFHLQEINHNTEICSNKDACDDTATSVSSYSNYKQRIDAMFDDSKSILSDASRSDKKRNTSANHRQTHPGIAKERVIANNIQEKIEKMFQELSGSNVQRRDSSASRDDSTSSGSGHDFVVTYLGSKPLLDKNVSLMTLQDPLKELYFDHLKRSPGNQTNVLTISKEGLIIKISDKEELNPFQSIAVWASVKLSFRVKSNATEYAFLPLVKDPDGVDKNLLFKQLRPEDKQCFQEKITEDYQSPIFAVVMKNKNKELECHGFVCRSSEDAIVIAANLYQALMKKLKRKKQHKEEKEKKSDDKDVVVEIPPSEENRIKPKVKVKKQAPPVPERKPSKPEEEKRQTPCSAKKAEENSEAKEGNAEKAAQRRGSVPNAGTEPMRTLRRTVSERGGNGIAIKSSCEGGDILTKVAIPRSSSFLNAKGPLSRFSGRSKTSAKNEVVSPLGFKELFNEFRLHEGLESMDDILNAIIDAEGMSFNDLKPIYKEFLLKLAVTLTKDELYQRSKIIMRRQKKRNKKCNFKKKAFMSSIGLNKIFRKTASRLGKSQVQKPTNLEFTSIVFQSSSKQFDSNLPNTNKKKSNSVRVKRKQSNRRRLAKRLEVKSKHVSTSEDSDFFQPRRKISDSGGGHNRSSSGYFSCSDCSCDSEKCTCTRTDKCYCTLGLKKSYTGSSSDESRLPPQKKSSFRFDPEPTTDLEPEDSLKSCSCDTESCVDSAKCYCTRINGNKMYNNKIIHLSDAKGICQTPHLHQKEKIHNGECLHYRSGCRKHGQLKDQGFAGSESNLSRAASPGTAWESNERDMKLKERLRAGGSLECLSGRLKPHHLECRRHPDFEGHLLKEIQNTSQRRAFCDDSGKLCVRGPGMSAMRSPGLPCGIRQYSSMRCRSEILHEGFPQPLQRSVSYRTKSIFSSVRSKHNCDSIMNHIKFPDHANSSLRFTHRMDVYNSFSENRPRVEKGSFFCHSHYKENTGEGFCEAGLPGKDCDGLDFSRENLRRPDFNRFTSQNSETHGSIINRKKVLVVSARDPKGKVLYMGTSSRCGSSCKNRQNFIENGRANASEAMAVKKSAEIAALLSDVTSKQKLNHIYFVKNQKRSNCRARSNSYRTTNMENTLGYLP